MNQELKIEGVNEIVNEFTKAKKQLIAEALQTFYQCRLPCYKDLSQLNEKCEIKCQQRLEAFDSLKKNTNKRYDAFLFKYDSDDMAKLQNIKNDDFYRKQL